MLLTKPNWPTLGLCRQHVGRLLKGITHMRDGFWAAAAEETTLHHILELMVIPSLYSTFQGAACFDANSIVVKTSCGSPGEEHVATLFRTYFADATQEVLRILCKEFMGAEGKSLS